MTTEKRNSKVIKIDEHVMLVRTEADGEPDYTVDLQNNSCTCPASHGSKCRHIIAAIEFTLWDLHEPCIKEDCELSEAQLIGSSDRKRKSGDTQSYPQNWKAYNRGQAEEMIGLMSLLRPLTEAVEKSGIYLQNGLGRPSLSDILFSMIFKASTGKSARGVRSHLKLFEMLGHIQKAPHSNTLSKYLNDAALTPILHDLITTTAMPLKRMEDAVAIDSSGFGVPNTVTWVTEKWGYEAEQRAWVKLHLTCGVRTNVVVAAEVSERHSNDSPYFVPLLSQAAKHFNLSAISADKAYLSRANLSYADTLGITARIPFKVNTLPVPLDDTPWGRAYHAFMFHQEEWKREFHLRSNVESTFSTIKRRFGRSAVPKIPYWPGE